MLFELTELCLQKLVKSIWVKLFSASFSGGSAVPVVAGNLIQLVVEVGVQVKPAHLAQRFKPVSLGAAAAVPAAAVSRSVGS